jgi:Calcineurin-like phosphoesterase
MPNFIVLVYSHDYHQNPQAQIDYYNNKRDNRWIMPDHSYNAIYPMDSLNHTVEIIFVDTSILCPSETWETTPKGIHAVSDELRQSEFEKIERMLKASTATWLIVAGHYTIYSEAQHGDNAVLIADFVPLLNKYGVQMYFNGHDHVMQHIEWNNVHYITSGHGADPPDSSFPPDKASVAASGSYFKTLHAGFAGVTATSLTLSLELIDKLGNRVHTHVLTNPRHGKPPSSFADVLIDLFTIAAPFFAALFGLSLLYILVNGVHVYYLSNYNPDTKSPDSYIAVNNPLGESSEYEEIVFNNRVELYADEKGGSPFERSFVIEEVDANDKNVPSFV